MAIDSYNPGNACTVFAYDYDGNIVGETFGYIVDADAPPELHEVIRDLHAHKDVRYV